MKQFELDRAKLRFEVIFTAVRSRGPGGQNVNKVSSAAQMTWDFFNSILLNWEQKNRIALVASHLMNKSGQIYFRSDEFRDLERNKERCLDKLCEAVAKALHIPKKRKATKPTKASKVKKRESKSKRSQLKKLRGKVEF